MTLTDTDFDAAYYTGSPARELMERAYMGLITGNRVLHAACLAGCEIEFGSELTPGGLRLTARTKYPVAFDERTGRVYERRAGP